MTDYEARAQIASLEAKIHRLEGVIDRFSSSLDGVSSVVADLQQSSEDKVRSDQTWLYFVKDLADGDRIIYVGITQDLDARWKQHNSDVQSAVWQYIDARGGSEYESNIVFHSLPAFACRKAARIAEKVLIANIPGLINKDAAPISRWYNGFPKDDPIPFKPRRLSNV